MLNVIAGLDYFEADKLDEVDKFNYFGSWLQLGGRISDEMCSRMQKTRLAFTNLKHLWRRHDISLYINDQVHAAVVGSVLQRGRET